MTKCNCNKCFKEFNVKLKTKKMQNGIEHNFLVCPYCKNITTAFYTNKEIRTMQVRQAILPYSKHFHDKGKDYQEFETNKEKIKNAMDVLKCNVESL